LIVEVGPCIREGDGLAGSVLFFAFSPRRHGDTEKTNDGKTFSCSGFCCLVWHEKVKVFNRGGHSGTRRTQSKA
jgi:hypothetical protein